MQNQAVITIPKQEYLELQKLKEEVAYYKQEIAELRRLIFASKSERFISQQQDPNQPSLFDTDTIEQEPVEKQEVTYTRKSKKHKKAPVRIALPSHLPRQEHVIEPDEDTCDGKKIGEEVTEILEYTPGEIFVKKYIRPKYVLKEKQKIVIGDLPSLPISKGNAGPGLLAHLATSKFVDHLPFYRLVQMLKRQEIDLAESTINDWFTKVCKLLIPLESKLRKQIKDTNYLMADETPIPVLTNDKPGSTHRGYHWVYYSPLLKLVSFDYRESRGREGPQGFLKNFKGALQTDGYNAYKTFEHNKDITLLACMAHARRKFEHAKQNDKQRTEEVLTLMQKLYTIEQKAREDELSFDQRRELRIEKAVPILHELEAWLIENKPKVMPRSAIGQAIDYTLKLWPKLKQYVNDGAYEIDNNLVENSIRPVALGRKNYMFAGSHDGAKRAAMMYSFFGSCKMNNVNPYQWLKNVLERIQDHKANKLEELLPSNWQNG